MHCWCLHRRHPCPTFAHESPCLVLRHALLSHFWRCLAQRREFSKIFGRRPTFAGPGQLELGGDGGPYSALRPPASVIAVAVRLALAHWPSGPPEGAARHTKRSIARDCWRRASCRRGELPGELLPSLVCSQAHSNHHANLTAKTCIACLAGPRPYATMATVEAARGGLATCLRSHPCLCHGVLVSPWSNC